MTVEVVGTGYGRVVSFRMADRAAAGVLTATLPFWWVPSTDAPERTWDVPPEAAVEVFVRAMELWVAEHAAGLVFVHAAAVAVAGRAVLLPGSTGTGKTTLCAALLAAGADYLSDEYAVVRAGGLVSAYPRPLSLRGADGRRATRPEDLGAATAPGPLPVALVVTVRHVDDGAWAVHHCSPAQGALNLLANAVCARSRPGDALEAVTLPDARHVEGVRGDAASAAHAVLALLDQG